MRGIVAHLVPGESTGARVPPIHAAADAGPRRRFGGTLEARGATGGCTVRNAFECVDAPRHVAAHLAGGGFGDGLPRSCLRWRLRGRGGRRRGFVLRVSYACCQSRGAEQSSARRQRRACGAANLSSRRIIHVVLLVSLLERLRG